jgi:TolA-binding protein
MLSIPFGSLLRLPHSLGALALAAVLVAGCGSQRAAIESPVDSTSTSQHVQTGDDPAAGTRIGERLGQLDARMRTAPPDSLPMLEAEYARLLAERAGAPASVQTGGAATTESDTSSGATLDTIAIAIDAVPAETRREPLPEGEPVATGDPAKLFKGLRPNEIATIPGYERTVRASTSARRENARKSSSRTAARKGRGRSGGDDARLAASQKPATVVRTPSGRAAQINSRGERKGLVAGITAARAGKYADAVAKLEPAVKSGKAGAEAGYYYALSLEKTGQTARAAEHYLRASRSGGALGQRSYLEYCRLLARTGERTKARQLLTQFLRRNPDSTQAVSARRLLQTL